MQDIHGISRQYSYIQYSRNIISEYSPEFHRQLFPNIPRIYRGNVPPIFYEQIFSWCVFVCVRVCVCVCVCVCMFILFHLLISSGCMTSVTYMRCSEQRSFVVSITRGFCQVSSSPFLSLSYFTSKDENCS